ncbi:MAG: hypothetical protein E4G89_04285 [Methanothrix sp.]|nr:MAG: hypothetical protein E4G89_04285 [Methanothrix sp.]
MPFRYKEKGTNTGGKMIEYTAEMMYENREDIAAGFDYIEMYEKEDMSDHRAALNKFVEEWELALPE